MPHTSRDKRDDTLINTIVARSRAAEPVPLVILCKWVLFLNFQHYCVSALKSTTKKSPLKEIPSTADSKIISENEDNDET